MESINCIICNSNKYSRYKNFSDPLGSTYLFNLVKCDCGLIYLNPRPDKQEISKYYDSSYLPHAKNRTPFLMLYNFIKKITFLWKYNILLKHSPKSKRVLDYGGGIGDFSSYLLKKNISAINYDPYIDKNSEAINSLFKKKFDIITFWHSIEHIHDIKNLFEEIDTLLDKNGILAIAVPNHDAYERKLFFNDNWIAYDIPRHLYHFNPKTFKKLLKKYNFTIDRTYSMYQDTLFNISMSYTKKNIIKFIYISFRSILFIFFNKNFSSSLLFICRKQ